MMAAIAKKRDDDSGLLATGGSSTAYTLTTNQGMSPLVDGYSVTAKITVTNGTAPQLNVDATGLKDIRVATATAMPIGGMLAKSVQTFTYSSADSCWYVHGNIINPSNAYTPGGADVVVADGGTGVSALTVFAPIFGGTTTTGPVQSGTAGTAGQVLTSTGTSSIATFQAAPGIRGFSRTRVDNNAGSPTTQLDVSWGDAFLGIRTGAVAVTLNAGSAGVVNGIDVGSLAASTVYHIHGITNGTTHGALLSLSATAPTLPSGYTVSERIGAWFTGAGSTFLRQFIRGQEAQYKPTAASTLTAYPTIKSGGSVDTSTSVAGLVPSTAIKIRMSMNINTNAGNASLGANAVDPLIVQEQTGTANTSLSFIGEFMLEGTTIFTGGANSSSKCIGWTDAVNAS